MKTRISVLIILFLISVLLISVIALACNPPPPPPTVDTTPTVTPTVPAPNGKILTVEEFVSNALAGKYKYGRVITVSGTVVDWGTYTLYLGPPRRGFTVVLKSVYGEDNGLWPQSRGTKIVASGEYNGEGIAIIVLENAVLVPKSE